MAVLSTVYMRVFLPDSIRDTTSLIVVPSEKLSCGLLEDYPPHRNGVLRAIRSVREMASLMRSRCV